MSREVRKVKMGFSRWKQVPGRAWLMMHLLYFEAEGMGHYSAGPCFLSSPPRCFLEVLGNSCGTGEDDKEES